MGQPRRRLDRHVNDEDALALAAVDPVDEDVSRGGDYPVADQLAMPVQIHPVSRDRSYRFHDLPVLLLAGGVAHQEQAPVLSVRERGDVFG